jgi:hypothetical protein
MTGRHTEAVMSITKQEDIQRVLAQSPISTDYGPVYVKMDGGVPEQSHDLYTGEKVILVQGTHNMEAVRGSNGLDALARICPAVDAKEFFLREHRDEREITSGNDIFD